MFEYFLPNQTRKIRIVKTGVVERMIWWNGIETIARETLDMAMLTVKSVEKAASTKFSPIVSFVRRKKPAWFKHQHPKDAEAECIAVSSQGNLNYGRSSATSNMVFGLRATVACTEMKLT